MGTNDSALLGDIAAIVQHTTQLPPEATAPISHYLRTASDSWNLLAYIERHLAKNKTYDGPRERHQHRLHRMVLLSLVEAFERFIKETAALCIDHVGPLVLDDRLKDFKLTGDTLAAHFAEKNLGKSLCESDTWLSCKDIDERFRRILADPFSKDLTPKWFLFPTEHQAKGEGWRRDALDVVWQLRHTIVHNAGVITQSDAAKLRLLVRTRVSAPVVLWPERNDVQNVKMLLADTASIVNQRVADRLGILLSRLHKDDPTLFDPSTRAQELAELLRQPVTIGSVAATPTMQTRTVKKLP